ncbi:Protein nedd1 [Actinomortierella ambigua]|uniref:Protein nedd1 n=1 Tax=Actinomortierella ambigua TaxID=1343610 RepID=A0A9P6U819_9FUNG|nr:Protein nedd1 [Actinomortierella ambigua]
MIVKGVYNGHLSTKRYQSLQRLRLYFANGSKALAWDFGAPNPTEMFETSSRINSLAINADDALLAAGQNDGTLQVFSRFFQKATKLDTSPSLVIGKLEYSYFTRSILGGTGNDGTLRLWETSASGSGSIYHSFPSTHESTISAMVFSPSNRYLICTAGLDRRYVLYDVTKKGVVKTTTTNHALTSAALKGDGLSMAFGTDQGEILLYDLRSANRPITTIDTGSRSPIMALHFQGKSNAMKRQQSGQAGAHGGSGASSNSNSGGHYPLKRQNSSGTKHLSLEPGVSLAASKSTGATRPASIKTTLAGALESTSGTPKETRSAVEQYKTGGLLSSLYPERSATTIETTTGSKKSYSAPTSAFSFSSAQQKQDPSSTTKPSQTGTGSGATPSTSSGANPRRAFTSVPTTPVRDSSTYSRLSAVSPSFQNMQSHPPSNESTPSSSSVNTPPPRSPGDRLEDEGDGGAAVTTPKASDWTTPSKPWTAEEYPAGPSTPSRHASKRRKSFGTLIASEGANSDYGTEIPEEKMEMLRSQIVDRVRGVMLGQEAQAATTSTTEGGERRTKEKERKRDDMKAVAGKGATTLGLPKKEESHMGPASSQRRASSSKPFHDIWLRAAGSGKDGFLRSSPLEQGHGSSTEQQQQHRWQRQQTTTVSTKQASSSSSSLPSTLDLGLSARLAAATAALNGTAATTTHESSLKAGAAAAGMVTNERRHDGGISDAGGGGTGNDFQVQILENVIQDCLSDFRQEMRRDIQNMHLELLRQFQIQKIDMENLMRQYSDTSDLWRQIEQLQEENRQLRNRTTRL